MHRRDVVIRRATNDDMTYIETLLDENELPTTDVRSHPEWFHIASAGESRVGIGGLESYGDVGLLRSVVVEQSARGEGTGTELCDALEKIALSREIDTLYLLTTTAADFFASRGYITIDRSEPPDPIQHTTQFDRLCPMEAICMEKSL